MVVCFLAKLVFYSTMTKDEYFCGITISEASKMGEQDIKKAERRFYLSRAWARIKLFSLTSIPFLLVLCGDYINASGERGLSLYPLAISVIFPIAMVLLFIRSGAGIESPLDFVSKDYQYQIIETAKKERVPKVLNHITETALLGRKKMMRLEFNWASKEIGLKSVCHLRVVK